MNKKTINMSRGTSLIKRIPIDDDSITMAEILLHQRGCSSYAELWLDQGYGSPSSIVIHKSMLPQLKQVISDFEEFIQKIEPPKKEEPK